MARNPVMFVVTVVSILTSCLLLRDLAIGFAIALAVFAFFVLVLTVNLPAGWLAPLFHLLGLE